MAEGAERAASVKLSLDSGEYLVELRKVGEENSRVATDSKKRFDAMGKGIDAAKGSLRGMLDAAKNGLTTLGTLGGAFTAANSVKQAVELNARFRHLAETASDASGRMLSYRDIQTEVERASALTSRTSDELTSSFEGLIDATGDLDFTKAALKSIGTAATGTGKDVGLLTQLAGTLNEKFGVSADQLDDAFATVIGNARKGGPTMEEFAAVADQLGANLIQAGMRGDQGLRFLLGSLNAVNNDMGDVGKSAAGVGQLLLNLGKGSAMKAMAKDLGIDPAKLVNEKDAIARLQKILSFGKKGLDTLKANFVGPEEQKALKILFTDPFEQALERAKASGLKGKDAIDQALQVLEGQIGEFGKTAVTAGVIQKRAAENATTPQANLRRALERLNQAFAEPAMLEAIDELSKLLPDLAKWFAKLVSFAAKSPLLAGTLAVGGRVGGSFLAGSAAELLKAHLAGGKAAGAAMGEGVAAGAKAGSGLLAGAGVAFGVAAAGLIAAEWIKNKADEDAKTTSDLAAAMAGASSTMGGRERQQALADQLQRSIAAAEESRSGFGGFAEDVFSGVGGLLTGTVPAATLKDDQIREAKEQLARKRAAIAAMVDTPAAAAGGSSSSAPTGRGRVTLDPAAPRLMGTAIADALGGKTLDVRIVSGGGVDAQARSFSGGRGPISMPAAQPGGGV